MKKLFSMMSLALLLLFASCGEQHKAQSLVKDFLKENLTNQDYSFERFDNIARTAMIDAKKVEQLRKDAKKLPCVNSNIQYQKGNLPDTLLYIRATYTLTGKDGKDQKLTQTFYMDKELTRVIAFKEN